MLKESMLLWTEVKYLPFLKIMVSQVEHLCPDYLGCRLVDIVNEIVPAELFYVWMNFYLL